MSFQNRQKLKTVWRFLKELKIELPYDPTIALLGIYPKDTDAVKRRDTCKLNTNKKNKFVNKKEKKRKKDEEK